MNKRTQIRLAFLIPSLQTGGAELQLLSLVKALDKTRFRVTVIVMYSGYALESCFESLPHVDLIRLEKRHAFDFTAFFRLIGALRRHKVWILQSFNVSARLWGACAAPCAGVPNIISMERTAQRLYSSWGSRFYLFAESYALRKSDRVIANSMAGKQFVISRNVPPERVRVIHNGLDPERLEITRSRTDIRTLWNIPDDAFCLVWVGRLEYVKDPFTFINVVYQLGRREKPLYALVVGDGSLMTACQEYTRALNLEQRIRFTGNRRNVADYYNAADLFVLTSDRVEGCSNTILEAMRLGTPVVASRVGGNPELIDHAKTGYLFEPNDTQGLADLIDKLIDAPELLNVAGSALNAVEKNYTQSAMVSAFETVYRQLIAGTGG